MSVMSMMILMTVVAHAVLDNNDSVMVMMTVLSVMSMMALNLCLRCL
jgi:hypothetical protein